MTTDERVAAAARRAAEAIIARPIEAVSDCDCEACGKALTRLAAIIEREMVPLMADAAAEREQLIGFINNRMMGTILTTSLDPLLARGEHNAYREVLKEIAKSEAQR